MLLLAARRGRSSSSWSSALIRQLASSEPQVQLQREKIARSSFLSLGRPAGRPEPHNGRLQQLSLSRSAAGQPIMQWAIVCALRLAGRAQADFLQRRPDDDDSAQCCCLSLRSAERADASERERESATVARRWPEERNKQTGIDWRRLAIRFACKVRSAPIEAQTNARGSISVAERASERIPGRPAPQPLGVRQAGNKWRRKLAGGHERTVGWPSN